MGFIECYLFFSDRIRTLLASVQGSITLHFKTLLQGICAARLDWDAHLDGGSGTVGSSTVTTTAYSTLLLSCPAMVFTNLAHATWLAFVLLRMHRAVISK